MVIYCLAVSSLQLRSIKWGNRSAIWQIFENILTKKTMWPKHSISSHRANGKAVGAHIQRGLGHNTSQLLHDVAFHLGEFVHPDGYRMSFLKICPLGFLFVWNNIIDANFTCIGWAIILLENFNLIFCFCIAFLPFRKAKGETRGSLPLTSGDPSEGKRVQLTNHYVYFNPSMGDFRIAQIFLYPNKKPNLHTQSLLLHTDFMTHIQLWEGKGYLFSKVVLNNNVAKSHSNAKLISTFEIYC